jgi:hypothetical protein
MFARTHNLRFENGDPLFQLVLRIRRKVFARELARSIALGARKIIQVHLMLTSQFDWLAVNGEGRYFPSQTGVAWRSVALQTQRRMRRKTNKG